MLARFIFALVIATTFCLCAPHQAAAQCHDDDDDGFTNCDGDCDDADAAVFPGATEVCNGIDDDCDGAPDDGLVTADWYPDADGDGYGRASATATTSCAVVADHVLDSTDCDDTDAGIHPGAVEACDWQDNDCDGTVDPEGSANCVQYLADADRDGFGVDLDSMCLCLPTGVYDVGVGGDCDDDDALIHPGALEVCNGHDDDCNPQTNEYGDADADGFSICFGDCDDADPGVNPAAEEVCNSLDDDCSATTDEVGDVDGDGYSICEGDCDDDDATAFPGAVEACDGADND